MRKYFYYQIKFMYAHLHLSLLLVVDCSVVDDLGYLARYPVGGTLTALFLLVTAIVKEL